MRRQIVQNDDDLTIWPNGHHSRKKVEQTGRIPFAIAMRPGLPGGWLECTECPRLTPSTVIGFHMWTVSIPPRTEVGLGSCWPISSTQMACVFGGEWRYKLTMAPF